MWDLIVSLPDHYLPFYFSYFPFKRCKSYFPFGFEGRMWDLIVSVPDHRLSFYFAYQSSCDCAVWWP